jgi:hypothetical protein
MHIKFINTGKGSARSAKEYLLKSHDAKGEIRESVEILRGNPEMVTAVAESLMFKHTYRSAVIAWHKDDEPTPEQIQEVLDEFERVAFAGLEPNQYTYYAVWHGESDGSGHIHLVTPRVELQTGKSMNIAPPGWQSTYDLIVDKYNTKYAWASPKDKHRQHLVVNDKMKIHAKSPHAEIKKMLDRAILDRIEAGLITDHSDVRSYLSQFGEITRTGKDYMSIKPDGFTKAIRLKGVAYGRTFNIERLGKEIAAEQRERSQTSTEDRKKEVKRIESAIERTIEKRALYHRRRYDYQAVRLQRESDQSPIRDRQGRKGIDAGDQSTADGDHRRDRGSQQKIDQDQVKAVDHTDSDRVFDHSRYVNRGIRPGEIRYTPGADTPGNRSRDQRREEVGEVQKNQSVQQRYHDTEKAHSVPNQTRRLGSDAQGELNDRIRKRVTSDSEAARGDLLQRTSQSIEQLRKEFSLDRQSIQRADERSDQSYREAKGYDRDAKIHTGEVQEYIKGSYDHFGQRANRTIRELVQRAGKRVGGLKTAVSRVARSIVAKINEIQKDRQRSRRYGGPGRGI